MKITLATKITISRMLLTLPAVGLYIAGQYTGGATRIALVSVACAIFAIACITDFLDGYVARCTHSVSVLGKYLDPVADKVNLCLMLFIIVCYADGLDGVYAANRVTIAILGGIIFVRELLVGMLRSIAAKRGTVISADIFGKIKTVFLNVGTAVLVVAGLLEAFAWIGTILFYIGAVITVVSGVHYFAKNADALKDDASESADESQKSADNSDEQQATENSADMRQAAGSSDEQNKEE